MSHPSKYIGKVILVEGEDDKTLMLSLNQPKEGIFVLNGYSKDKLGKKLNDIKNGTTEFQEDISSLLIIVDTDGNLDGRKEEILDLLKKYGLELPTDYKLGTIQKLQFISVGIFLLPNNEEPGSLETLLLKSISHDSLLTCTEKLIDCRKNSAFPFKKDLTLNQQSKMKLNLYLDLLKVDHDFHYDKTYQTEINSQNDCFKPLRSFIDYQELPI